MNTVLKYPGSKWSTAKWIISNFPQGYEKMTYLEPFFGSGAVFFNKNRSSIETINDLDSNVINLFKIIREQPQELSRLLEYTPWSREEYKTSYENTGESLEDARRFLIRMWQAIGSKTSDITGWRNNIQDLNGNVNQWSTKLPVRIVEAADRLRHTKDSLVQVENQPAIKLIERHNKKNVFIYCDPPYVRSTRHGRIYKCEMTDNEHVELLQVLNKHSGPVMISGYESDLYNDILKGWRKEELLAQCEGGRQRTEIIWMNYEANTKQISVFDAV